MKTIKQTLAELNKIKESMTINDFIEKFSYLTNITRGEYTSYRKLINAYETGTFGTLIRKLDPDLFHTERSN